MKDLILPVWVTVHLIAMVVLLFGFMKRSLLVSRLDEAPKRYDDGDIRYPELRLAYEVRQDMLREANLRAAFLLLTLGSLVIGSGVIWVFTQP